MPRRFTAASRSARRSSGTSSPSSSTLIRIESIPLFLPSTIRRSAPTTSDEYGSIASGSWNWLATAPLSRVKSVSPTAAFHGSSGVADSSATRADSLPRALQPQRRLDAVQPAQRQRDLGQVRVPGALAHPVHGAVDPPRARLHGGDRGRRRQAEVVVAVEVQRARPVPDRRSRTADDELRDGLGSGDADRVDDDDLARARLDGAVVRRVQEVAIRPGSVDAEVRDHHPALGRERDGAGDPVEHRLATHAERAQLQIRDGRLDDARGQPQLHERLHVGRHRAREAPHLGVEVGGCDAADRLAILVGDAREAGLDALDAERVDEPGDLQLVLGREHDADGLLAVAQGRVVEADLRGEAKAVVDRSGPEVGHQRKSSGNGDSFSAPSAVTRKLSSSRRPPPSGQ